MLLNCGGGEDSWESLGLQRDPTSQSYRRSVLNNHWKDWCWSWNSNALATWCEELTHLKRPWFWERLKAGGEGDNRGWDGWMASLTRWKRVWASSRSCWWTGKPGVLLSMGLHRTEDNWENELTDWGTHDEWWPSWRFFYRFYRLISVFQDIFPWNRHPGCSETYLSLSLFLLKGGKFLISGTGY